MNKEKLADYLDGLATLSQERFQLGAIIYQEDQKEQLKAFLEENNFELIKEDAKNLLQNLTEKIKNGQSVGFVIVKKPPSALYNFLENLNDNKVDSLIAGSTEKTFLSPLPKGGFMVLLISKEAYNNLELGEILISVCKI